VHKLQLGDQAARRIVLGDWDRQGWALQVDDHGFALAPFDFARRRNWLPPPTNLHNK
jgi:UDP-2,3-diacylglucosamine hydrolase